MSFGYNRINYGIHSIVPFRIADGKPYGILKVLGGGTMNLSSEFQELYGGSSKFSWAVEASQISAEWTATVKSYPDFAFELFLGATVSTTAASATGTVGTPENVLGTAFDPVSGIASVAAKTGAENDLKDAVYLVEAVTGTTVNVYAMTDIEFKKLGATNFLSYVDESLKINATPIAISDGVTVDLVGAGIEFTGGTTVAMTPGDTFRFDVRSPHKGLSQIDIGSSTTTFPEHRQICLSQKRSNGDTFEMELYRVVASGMAIPMEEQAFSIPEMNMRLVYDGEKDKIATIRAKRG